MAVGAKNNVADWLIPQFFYINIVMLSLLVRQCQIESCENLLWIFYIIEILIFIIDFKCLIKIASTLQWCQDFSSQKADFDLRIQPILFRRLVAEGVGGGREKLAMELYQALAN